MCFFHKIDMQLHWHISWISQIPEIQASLRSLRLLSGVFAALYQSIPECASGSILVFVGLLLGRQAFEETPARHYPALLLSLFPYICNWAKLKISNEGVYMMGQAGGLMCRDLKKLSIFWSSFTDPRESYCFSKVQCGYDLALLLVHRPGLLEGTTIFPWANWDMRKKRLFFGIFLLQCLIRPCFIRGAIFSMSSRGFPSWRAFHVSLVEGHLVVLRCNLPLPLWFLRIPQCGCSE